ncbi:class I SAM-dependent methyltransferase [Flexibacterium corallicola]|uniref:hypothetical protein n=1 Tax=Flexibacterium corallicola TaxID=3037259 RepID=UPI00286F2919|nr:hypothetical protein [Pseudovibrio sp. M1P-2-3]
MSLPSAQTIKSATRGMRGGGFYDKNSGPQSNSISHILPWLEEAVADLPDAEHVRVADFGCAEGRNSLRAMGFIVDNLRRKHSGPVSIVESDVPSNDYTAILNAIAHRSAPPFTDPHVFGGVVSGSMYDQLLPPASTHLAMSFNAIAYMSRRPAERIKDHIIPGGIPSPSGKGKVTAKEFEICAKQARLDLEQFFEARAFELVKGGKLLVQCFARSTKFGEYPAPTNTLNEALIELVEAGKIPRDTYEKFYRASYLRDQAELLAPVTTGGKFSHLFHVDRFETYNVDVPAVVQFKRDNNTSEYAHQLANFVRAYTESDLYDALATTDHSTQLVEDVYMRIEEIIYQSPKHYEFQFHCHAILLTYLGDQGR